MTGIRYFLSNAIYFGENTMSKVGVDVPQSGAKPPFTFRTTVAIALLAVNILVAAMYHHVINP